MCREPGRLLATIRRNHLPEIGHYQWSVGSSSGLGGGPWFATLSVERSLLGEDRRPHMRIYLGNPGGTLILGIWRGRAQLWLPMKGYTMRFVPVAWHPRYRSKVA
jgi:hypothetical protein